MGEEESNVNKLVEMTEERTAALVPMEMPAVSIAVAQQQLMQAQQNGPMLGVNEGVEPGEEDNSSEDDS